MSTPVRILGIAGSLRRESYNRAALRAAAQIVPEGVTLGTFALDGIPGFNQDEEQHPPASITGACGIVGAAPLGAEASFDINDVTIPGKTIRGLLQGESVPKVLIPRLVELHAQGHFPFDKLVKFYSLGGINQAAEDSEKGGTIKPIIRV